MAETPQGFTVFEGEIIAMKGPCHAGHKVGDKLALSCWETGGLCGFFYHDIFPALSMMQFGGQYPWAAKDHITVTCVDPGVRVKMIVRRKE